LDCKIAGRKNVDKLTLIAIGTATAKTLEQILSAEVITNSGANSEALLELEALSEKDVRGKKIIIFRGEGGREHLATTDVVIVTSNKGLENLFSLLNEEQRNILLGKQLLVMGERMLDFSNDFGFTRPPILAEESSDEGILSTIVKWAASK